MARLPYETVVKQRNECQVEIETLRQQNEAIQNRWREWATLEDERTRLLATQEQRKGEMAALVKQFTEIDEKIKGLKRADYEANEALKNIAQRQHTLRHGPVVVKAPDPAPAKSNGSNGSNVPSNGSSMKPTPRTDPREGTLQAMILAVVRANPGIDKPTVHEKLGKLTPKQCNDNLYWLTRNGYVDRRGDAWYPASMPNN